MSLRGTKQSLGSIAALYSTRLPRCSRAHSLFAPRNDMFIIHIAIVGDNTNNFLYYNETPLFHGIKSSWPSFTDLGSASPLATFIT